MIISKCHGLHYANKAKHTIDNDEKDIFSLPYAAFQHGIYGSRF